MMNIIFFKEIQILEENKELENALRNIQLPTEEIKKLEDSEISKIFKRFLKCRCKREHFSHLKKFTQ